MPIVPTYKQQERWQIPSVDKNVSDPIHLKETYQNNISRTGELLSQAQTYWFGNDKKEKSFSLKQKSLEKASSGESFQREVNMRAKLLNDARKQVEETGVLSAAKLDEYVVQHFTPQDTAGSVGQDYLVLRQIAHQDKSLLEKEMQKKTAQTEAELICQVGTLLPNKEALDEYLASQLPSYEEHLRQTGETAEDVRLASQVLQEQVLSRQISRFLSGGNWEGAENVFTSGKNSFSPLMQRKLATKICASFARNNAAKLWKQSQKEKNNTLEDILHFCRKNIKEKDPSIKESVLANIEGIFWQEKQNQQLDIANLYEKLFHSSPAEILPLLMGETGRLESAELAQALQVAGKAFQPVTHLDEKNFVKLYFHGSCEDIFSAWKLHQISAAEYWLLQYARTRREVLGLDQEAYFLCSGIRQFCTRQKYDTSSMWRAVKAVLAGGTLPEEQLQTWEKIKKLLNN